MAAARQESDHTGELLQAFDGFALGDARMRVPVALFLILISGVTARGASRGDPGDVTAPETRTPAAMAARVDELLAETWSAAGVDPAPAASDGEFLRRASLDFTGVIPRTSEVREFLADARPDKREKLIERLIAAPRYATHMATTWRNRILPQGVDSARGREALGLQKWLRTRFAENTRYDRIVGGLLLATGENEVGPALYFQANDAAPEKLAGSAAELFMGVDLHCAQCHDHPFADWSQRDFWSLAAFFARTKSADDGPMDSQSMSYRLVDVDRGDVTLPESDEVVAPKFPLGDAAADEPWQTRRSQLVVWLTSRDNEFFARSTVNASWQHLFGQTLVESIRPLDGEPPSVQRQILDELATNFAESNFNLRGLWQTLASTRAYQLSSQHPNAKAARPELFARMLPKPLTPEQLYDSFVLLAPPAAAPGEYAEGQSPSESVYFDEDPRRIEFVRRMRTPPGSPTQYQASTLQALMLMNGAFTAATASPTMSSLLGALEAPYLADAEQVDALFLATLAREPGEDERAAVLAEFERAKSDDERRLVKSDVLWALLNSTEFAFNH
jgi:hypothetical protein